MQRQCNTGHYTHRINWKVEIRRLMDDFGFERETIEGIIRTTENECPKKTSAEDKYEHAWRKFWALLSY